jgi:hypothetical protein
MGCGDSKNVNVGKGNDSAAPVAGVVSRSPEEGREAKEIKPTQMRQFTVVLQKRNESDSLGMNLGILFSSGCLLVKELINEGLVFEWNENNVNTPDRIVRAGDFITAVNGTTGRIDSMMNRLKEQTLMLTVARQEDLADATIVTTQERASADDSPTDTTTGTPEREHASVASSDEVAVTHDSALEINVERAEIPVGDPEEAEQEDQFDQNAAPVPPRPVFQETTTSDVPFKELTAMSDREKSCNRCGCSF